MINAPNRIGIFASANANLDVKVHHKGDDDVSFAYYKIEVEKNVSLFHYNCKNATLRHLRWRNLLSVTCDVCKAGCE